MLTLTKLNQQLVFPPADMAHTDPNGLLAFGGDLSAKRLLLAYSSGIFRGLVKLNLLCGGRQTQEAYCP